MTKEQELILEFEDGEKIRVTPSKFIEKLLGIIEKQNNKIELLKKKLQTIKVGLEQSAKGKRGKFSVKAPKSKGN
jgi:hypothetical protein